MSEPDTSREHAAGRWCVAVLVMVSCTMSGCIFGSGDNGVPADADADVSTRDVQDTAENRPDGDSDLDTTGEDATDSSDSQDATDTMVGPDDCTDEQTFCSGECIDTSSSVRHCGACEKTCEELPGTRVQCQESSCVHTCRADRSDLDEDLGTEDSNGCEGECPEDSVGTYYTDIDRDSYGNSDTARRLCASEAGPELATRGGDCQDQNSDVNPGAGFSEAPRADGSFDFNCNGSDEKEFPVRGECDDPFLGSCSYSAGWDGDVPGCGESAAFMTGCCDGKTTETRTQRCK